MSALQAAPTATKFPIGSRVLTVHGHGRVVGAKNGAFIVHLDADYNMPFFGCELTPAPEPTTPEEACAQLARTAGFKMPAPAHRDDFAGKPSPDPLPDVSALRLLEEAHAHLRVMVKFGVLDDRITRDHAVQADMIVQMLLDQARASKREAV